MESFDLIVIGVGAGRLCGRNPRRAIGTSNRHRRERQRNSAAPACDIGCIPSKALLSSSDHFAFAKKEAAKHGIVLETSGSISPTMLPRKDKVVKSHERRREVLMKLNKITTFQGLGSITAPGRVTIKPAEGRGQEIEAKHIIIATGSVPVELPSMKFDGNVIVSSTEALRFREVAEEAARHRRRRDRSRDGLGLEPARLGSDRARISPAHRARFRSRARECAPEMLTAQGMEFHLGTKVGEVKVENGRAIATATKGEEQLTFEADKVLVSVGRRAFPEGSGAEKLGVALDDRGAHQSRRAFPHQRRRRFTRSATSSPGRCSRTRPRRKASPVWK